MKLFNTLAKKITTAVVVMAAAAGLTGAVKAGFGPGRATFTLAHPAQYVTFNSYTDNTTVMGGTGDERAFSTGAIDGASQWSDPVVNAKSGDEVTVRAYVHNNAQADLNLVAQNVSFKVNLPTDMTQVHQITSTISSSNANPTEVFDTLDVSAEQGYLSQLEYVPGSASFKNNFFTNGTPLPDTIVTSGATLGYNALDGKIPGCLNFSGWVTFKVRVKVPAYEIAKTARLSGEGADKWRESVNATPGQQVEYRIEFINNGATALQNIRIYDKLPTYMTVVPGSVILVDGANPSTNPYVFGSNAVTENGTHIDVMLSNSYPANSNAFIRFKAVIAENDTTKCGTVKFTNVAYAQPGTMGVVNDGTDVYLVTGKTCVTPETPVYSCSDLTIEKLGGRQIKATVTANGTPASRVVLKNIEYTFGDGSTPLVSTANTAEHTYTTNGTYNVSAKVTFAVDGVNHVVGGTSCAATVTFTTTPTATKLPKTGASSTLGVFIVTTMLGMFAFRAYAVRKNS